MRAIAGPDALWLRASAPHEEKDGGIFSEFTISEGERIPFVLTGRLLGSARWPSTGAGGGRHGAFLA